ncbi:MAG: hypothetical protein U0936_15070 [Planctomycetaceae bacterium]
MSDHAKQEIRPLQKVTKNLLWWQHCSWIAVGGRRGAGNAAMLFMLAGQSHAPADAEHAEETTEGEHGEPASRNPTAVLQPRRLATAVPQSREGESLKMKKQSSSRLASLTKINALQSI